MRRVLLTLVLMASTIGFAASPASAGTPKAKASVSKGLVDAQIITVSWHGFKPHDAKHGLYIIQCLPDVATFGFTVCDRNQTHEPTEVDAPVPSSGSADYIVHTGANNVNGVCGVSPATNDCVIWVAAIGSHGIEQQAVIPIKFDLALTTPSVMAEPTTDLTNHENVHLTSTQYSATQDEQIYECNHDYRVNGLASCQNLVGRVTGNFDLQVPVRTGKIGTSGYQAKCGTTAENSDKCVLAVVPSIYAEGVVAVDVIYIPISFTPPA